ncbi:MAG: N-acetylglucosamine-6-phosphate deacetylase [Anaerolineae bacterium]|nr:N-acetylglucosamine-6-phosphate deacetylase [Anaerolineae bacterium]
MNRVIIINGRVFTPGQILEHSAVIIEGGKIVEITEGLDPTGYAGATIIDAAGKAVIPGFIDIHVHGGVGYDTMDATPQAIQKMAAFFASHGVTGFLPTTVTASREAILAAIENTAAGQSRSTGGAQVLGVHVEGPYINPSKPGAQPLQHIRPADPDEYRQFFAWNNVRLITLAPEIPENKAFIPYAVQQGATVAVGHSAASYEEVLDAVRLGLSHACHTFNGMVGLHHREPGTVGAVLTCAEITAEVIADNVHVHPAVIKLLVQAKGVERTVLMTDAIRAAGLPDGTYELGGQPVTVHEGVARIATGSLAGSTLTMDRAVRNAMAATGLSLAEVLPMASYNPARVIGMEREKGSLEPGKDADIVLLDDEEFKVTLTMVGGWVVYEA